MQSKKLLCLTAAAVLAVSTSAFADDASASTLSGAGSTLIQPLEGAWATGWNKETGNSVSYSGVGSGGGIDAITAGSVQFGASDAPLTSSQASACSHCIQIPWALSATAIGYNLKGVKSVKLTGTVLAEIYLGQIKTWNSPAIAKLNKGEKLPNEKITPIYRSDSSGDTYAFTNYLSHVSGTWKSKVGTGTLVSFPAGSGNKGNLGVTTTLTNTSGAIAYAAVPYLIGHPVVAVANADNQYEQPGEAEIEAAGQTVTKVPSNNAISIVDPPKSAKIAYPISTFTYVIVPTNSSAGSLLRSFIGFCLSKTGQGYGATLDFATLPKAVAAAANASVSKIQ